MEKKIEISGNVVMGTFNNCNVTIKGRTNRCKFNNCNVKKEGESFCCEYTRCDITNVTHTIQEGVKQKPIYIEVEKVIEIEPDIDTQELMEKVELLMEVNHAQAERIKQLEKALEKKPKDWELEPSRFQMIEICKNLRIWLDDIIDDDETGRYEWITNRHNKNLRNKMLHIGKYSKDKTDKE